jgi:polyisoprenyl-teichoic acid--peptidoglycan teichoic acid transferase
MGPEKPPRVGLGVIKRAVIAGLLIMLATASAVSATVILEVDAVKDEFLGEGREQIEIPEITRAEAGAPRTIMLLGSDERYGDKRRGNPVRSDTIILMRVDPDADAISVMSIPRDLKVKIKTRKYGVVTDRINRAFSEGGPRLTLQTVKRVLSRPGKPFDINNVMVVDFGGFRRAVDYIGGVYVDVDRRYYNDNAPPVDSPEPYATIDIQPGYQRLKGQDALDYVRYRHLDNDFIRAARQQDFLRQLKGTAGIRRLFRVGDRHQLARIFGRYVQVDRSLRSTGQIINLMQLAIFSRGKKVNEVQFRTSGEDESYVEASESSLRKTVDEFLSGEASATPRRQTRKPNRGDAVQKRAKRRSDRKTNRPADVKGLEVAQTEGENQAIVTTKKLDFPFYFPRYRTTGSTYVGDAPRAYTIRDETGVKHSAYRMVLSTGRLGEYYGIQGTSWRDPPILDSPDRTRRVGGRRLQLYYDGERLRMVAWKTPKGVYWVSNTLSQAIDADQMVGIAASLQRLGGG